MDIDDTKSLSHQVISMKEKMVFGSAKLIRCLLLSRAIKTSMPSRSREVFSLAPVSLDAFFSILSSMFSVILL